MIVARKNHSDQALFREIKNEKIKNKKNEKTLKKGIDKVWKREYNIACCAAKEKPSGEHGKNFEKKIKKFQKVLDKRVSSVVQYSSRREKRRGTDLEN